jgi:exodeoxyribonuclease V beta subunit
MTGARMSDPIRYPYPALLDAIAPGRAAAIEASAGTGKTHLIEHLVVDRVLRGVARLEEIVVVTFTERAAAELRRRIRTLLANVAAGRAPAGAPAAPAWTIDAAAQRALEEAAAAVDLAPISTIHAFCNRILVEQAFAGGRLFAETQVESRTAFHLAFADVVRGPLATDPALAPYLAVWLGEQRIDKLEELLYKARGVRCDWAATFDPERLARAAGAFVALRPETVAATVLRTIKNGRTARAVTDRFDALRAAVLDFCAGEVHPAVVLARIDRLVKDKNKEVFVFIEHPTRLGGRRADPDAARLLDVVAELAEAAVPLATAVAQRLGPPVEERLAARKRAAGHYDFDDMLAVVAEALRGPRGPGLVAALRARYRIAIIDEFQDTDPLQWEIFRAVFDEGTGENPLYVIGDPKQSIYGFRGADAATYAEARDAIGAAVGSPPHRLSTNFRSTPAVIDAENTIFDPASLQPFFEGGLDYHPVVPSPAALPAPDGPPITLLRVASDDERDLPMRAVRVALARAIAAEVARLLAGPAPPPAKEIFVLTRTRVESQTVADALAARGIPHVLYNQEGLYDTKEASQVRDLLRAIEDPHDREKRLAAWLTPFFGLRLEDLPAAAAGGDQALVDRLLEWHAFGETHDLGRLGARVLDASGVVRRELFARDSQRRLTNFQHLFDAVAALGAEAPLGQVVQDLTARVAKLVVPAPEEGNQLRAEGDRDAVQIMTLHKAKGLEADVVFLYGGFWPGPNDLVRAFTVDGRRTRLAGRPRRAGVVELAKRERDAEDQRLYYVGLTRARRRLYLPYSGSDLEEAPGLDESGREELWKLKGGYRHVNRRLRALAADPATRRLFAARDVPVIAAADDEPVGGAAALAAWRPDPADLAPVVPDPELGRLRRKRAGTTQTSYSRIKQAHGGYRPPTEMLDEAAPHPEPDGRDELPGGARAGIFLHDLLEQLPPESVDGAADAEGWGDAPEVRAIFDRLMRKHGRDRWQLEPAIRLAYAALTAPLPVVGGALPRLARSARVARELEFLFPFPEAAGGPERGFVKGYVDVIFEHEGRTYFGDWKTDRLPGWDAETIAAHVDANYALQERLYALALCRMLGIEDEAGYEARFGGTLYLFVRGLPGAIQSRRPSWVEIERWRGELPEALAATVDAEGSTPEASPEAEAEDAP